MLKVLSLLQLLGASSALPTNPDNNGIPCYATRDLGSDHVKMFASVNNGNTPEKQERWLHLLAFLGWNSFVSLPLLELVSSLVFIVCFSCKKAPAHLHLG